MKAEFIVSLFGADRIGLIKYLLQNTHRLNGQWLSSKFSNLDGQFAGLIRLSVAQENENELRKFFSEQKEMTVQFNPVDEVIENLGRPFKLNVEANDRFGLINDITNILLSLGAYITHMDCSRLSVIEIGGSLLSVDITLNLPGEIKPKNVLDELDALGDNVVASLVEM